MTRSRGRRPTPDHHRKQVRRGGRYAGLAALLAVVGAAAWLILSSGGEHRYKVIFLNAGQLVPGDVVRIGGTPVGTVTGIGLTDNALAEVRITVADDFAPLHQGSTAIIRAQGLTGVASRYVDISPAPGFEPALQDGDVIAEDRTQSIVEIDQLFNTLDRDTRAGLERLIEGSASWYDGKEQRANLSARYFNPAIGSTARLFDEIERDSGAFEQFLVQTGDAMSALTENRAELTALVSNARRTAQGLGQDTQALSSALAEVPPALHQGSQTFVALRPALDDLEALAADTGPATRDLVPFLRRLRPVLAESTPAFAQLRRMFARPGEANDLLDALLETPALARLVDRSFPNAQRALRESAPVFSFARPYVPDLVAWVRSFGQAMSYYDANGHYARTLPVFDAFEFVDDSDGGHLDPKPPADRGRSSAIETGNLRRCPGAAAPPPADGSAPFVDIGELANPDCDPAQRPGARP